MADVLDFPEPELVPVMAEEIKDAIPVDTELLVTISITDNGDMIMNSNLVDDDLWEVLDVALTYVGQKIKEGVQ